MFYQFNSSIAKKVGIEDAIILHCLYVWIAKNAANNQNLYEDRYWTYNSVEAWHKLLPFISERSVKRHLADLSENGLLLRRTDDKNPTDRTIWYTFSDEGLKLLSVNEYNICPILHLPKMVNAKCQTGTMQSAKLAQCLKYNNIIYLNNINNNIKENNKSIDLLSKKNGEKPSEEEMEEFAKIYSAAQDQQAPPPTPSPNEDKEERLRKMTDRFIEELKPYEAEFGAQMLNEFFLYWSEPNKSRTKIRKDMQPTWDTHRRLLTWQRNNKKDIMRHGTYLERKAEAKRQSDLDTMQRLAAIAARGYSPKQENDEELGF